MTEPDSPEDVPLPRGLRPSRVPLAMMVGGIVLCGSFGLWLLLRPPESAALGAAAPLSMPMAANVQHFRMDVPEYAKARAEAGAAGILGVLKARTVTVAAAPEPEDPELPRLSAPLAHDAMSAPGAVMGDLLGSNFGFGGLGVRAAGRAGAIAVAAEPEPEAALALASESGTKSRSADDPEPAVDSSLLDAMSAQRGRDSLPAARPSVVRAPMLARATRAMASDAGNANGPAAAFFAHYASLDGLTPQSAHGYWRNTYVPGDPGLRMLQARLASYDRNALLPDDAHELPLDAGVRQSARPFDAPSEGALSAFVSASERGVTGRRRIMVQVGLQATPRFSGQRPALNLAIVLDLRDAPDAVLGGQLRALLAAFVAARDVSDRFRLYVAGPGGGLVVDAEAFRSGPVTVALQRLLGERSGPASALVDTVDAALEELQSADDPTAPLGSSGLVLIHASAPGAELDALASRLHRGALDGVPSSVFALDGRSGRIGDKALMRLALAGQGNRRLITSTDDAQRAVDQELSSVARVVARALRLRIRLAPGVQLIGVLGSKRLDELRAEQVRAAEQRIDQRVSRSLGIRADRGEDEEGIQIVIPSFYAGDSHVILLDVVVPGAGPVLDLSVRYKDLVQLENAVLRQSLALANQALARGPLQEQVLESLLAHELASRLEQAGQRVAAGDAPGATHLLLGLGVLLDDARQQLPGLIADRQFQADRQLVRDYVRLSHALVAPAEREFLSDSLRFASLMKSQPRPRRDGTGVEP